MAYLVKYFTFAKMVERIEKAFPEFDIAEVGRKLTNDARQRVNVRHAWQIIISEKLELPTIDTEE